MAAAAPFVGLAATGFSAAGSLMGADKAAQGDQVEAQNAVDAAQIGKTKAAETDADMRRRLSNQLATITAIRAGAGLNPNSPTGAAINANVQGVGDLSRTQAIDNINAQVLSDQNAAAFYMQSAGNALTGGLMGAAGSIFGGLSGAFKSGGFSGAFGGQI